MTGSREIDPVDVGRALWRRRYFVLASGAAFGLAALAANLFSPDTYQARALARLPGTSRQAVDRHSERAWTTLYSVEETRALLERFPAHTAGCSAGTRKAFNSVALDPVHGSEDFFRIRITAKSDPGAAAALVHAALEHLNGHPAVRDEVDRDRAAARARVDSLDAAIARATRDRGRAGPGARDELGIAALREARDQAQAVLTLLRGYQLVDGPVADPEPVAPRTLLSTAIYAMLGLSLGALTALLGAAVARRADGGA